MTQSPAEDSQLDETIDGDYPNANFHELAEEEQDRLRRESAEESRALLAQRHPLGRQRVRRD